jgi:hypothetical protein
MPFATRVRNLFPCMLFPVRYSNKKSMEFLETAIKDNQYLQQFNNNIKEVFEYFEVKKQLPIIMVNKKGEYVTN